MADTVYKVAVDFETQGSLAPPTSPLEKLRDAHDAAGAAAYRSKMSAEGLQTAWSSIGSAVAPVVGAFERIVETLGRVAMGAGLAGAALAGMQLKSGFDFAEKLEGTGIALADIFSANGYARNMGEGLTIAQDQLGKMQQDAKMLPGEFQDLANIMRTIASPAAQVGMSVDKMRQMSSGLMAFGATAGLDMATVAREAAMMLEGRFGAHNMLGTRLGFGHEEGKKSREEIAKDVAAALDKHKESIGYYADSMAGLKSTLSDNLRQFAAKAAGPVFEGVKGTLREVNAWFDNNQTTLAVWAGTIGHAIWDAFEWGKQKIAEWWPAVQSFVKDARATLISLWEEIRPYTERAFAAIRESLADGSAIDKLKTVLELYVAAKIGSGVAPMLGGLMQAAQLFGGGGALAGAAPALGGGALLAGAGALGMGSAMNSNDKIVNEASNVWWAELKTQARGLADAFTALGGDVSGLMQPLQALGMGFSLVASEFMRKANLFLTGEDPSEKAGVRAAKGIGTYEEEHIRRLKMRDEAETKRVVEIAANMHGHARTNAAQAMKDHTPKPHVPAGGHTTNIGKVEITVSSNHDPNRIARVVYKHIQDNARNPKTSSMGRDWYMGPASGY